MLNFSSFQIIIFFVLFCWSRDVIGLTCGAQTGSELVDCFEDPQYRSVLLLTDVVIEKDPVLTPRDGDFLFNYNGKSITGADDVSTVSLSSSDANNAIAVVGAANNNTILAIESPGEVSVELTWCTGVDECITSNSTSTDISTTQAKLTVDVSNLGETDAESFLITYGAYKKVDVLGSSVDPSLTSSANPSLTLSGDASLTLSGDASLVDDPKNALRGTLNCMDIDTEKKLSHCMRQGLFAHMALTADFDLNYSLTSGARMVDFNYNGHTLTSSNNAKLTFENEIATQIHGAKNDGVKLFASLDAYYVSADIQSCSNVDACVTLDGGSEYSQYDITFNENIPQHVEKVVSTSNAVMAFKGTFGTNNVI